MLRPRRTLAIVLLVLVLLLGLPSAAVFYTDWLWFREVGFERLFLRSLNAQFAVFAATFGAAFFFLYTNFRIARTTLRSPHVVFGTTNDGQPLMLKSRSVAGLAMPVSLGFALVLGYAASHDWLAWLSYLHAAPFGQADPLFHRDVSFYVFTLPVYDLIRGQALILTVLAMGGCGLLYVASGSFVFEPRFGVAFWPRLRLARPARLHLTVLAVLLLGLMSWGAWLDLPRMLLTQGHLVFGASYVDVHAQWIFLEARIVVLLAGCGLVIWYGAGRRGWPLPLAVALYVGVGLTGSVYASFVQRFVVTPNEQDKEQPYLLHNIAATRRAYDLERVEELELTGDAELTPQDIINNAETIENVRLWDHAELLKTFAQIQEIRTYYDFNSVDNDRYMISGKYRQVMLSAREITTDSLQNPSWVKERLIFTHGYGLTLGPVNQVTTEGLPVLYIQDLPPVSTVNLPVTEPSIYFGEKSSDYALVKTTEKEFHYPRGDDPVMTVYQGSGGVQVGGFWRRLLFALRFGTTNILVTPQITKDSRILFHRQIVERTHAIAPFLEFDADPYLVISEGRLFWMQDAYTTTANYPYSTPVASAAGALNYIRNSVKIVIDAYNGTTTFYLADPADPIARTLQTVFPDLFRPLDAMPADLRQHIRYPEDIFRLQASVFATYHMTNPKVFYNKEDQWEVPVLDSDRTPLPMQPYYTVMKLPGEKHAEFIQMLPFTPRLKDNLSAWMVARSDPGRYGKMVVFQYPKQKLVYGPTQIVRRINQDETISPQITLWDQQGSQVIQGTLLVIPIEKSLLYVRPLYLQTSSGVTSGGATSQGRIPELKRVIVAYQTKIVMKDTLKEALMEIFGRGISAALPVDRLERGATSVVRSTPDKPDAAAVADPDKSLQELVAEAYAHHEKALKAQREGDWALYGEEQKKLTEVFKKLAEIIKKAQTGKN